MRVPLRYTDAADKRTILVAVSVVRADRPSGKRPLIVLSGGPGEPIAATARSLASSKSKLRRADVFASSYGTRVALAAARRDSEWVGRIVLSSAIPPQSDLRRRGAGQLRPGAASAQPDLRGVDELQADLRGSRGQTRECAVLARGVAAERIHPDGKAATLTALPRLIDALARRDPALLTEASAQGADGLQVAQGQQYAVLCAEELGATTPEKLRAGLSGLPSAARLLREFQAGLSPVLQAGECGMGRVRRFVGDEASGLPRCEGEKVP